MRDGTINIETITDETLKEKIDDYQEWCFENQTPLYLVTGGGILSNCWDALKIVKLQRRDEISSSVNVAKAEKINDMVYGEIKAQFYIVS